MEEITQSIGSMEKFGYLLEDGFNVLEANIFLGGMDPAEKVEVFSLDETKEQGEYLFDVYHVTSAWEQDGLVMVNATIWDNSASAILTSGE